MDSDSNIPKNREKKKHSSQHSLEMVSPKNNVNPFDQIIEREAKKQECNACRRRMQEYISKSYSILCVEEVQMSQGLAVNSVSGELIALYEGLAQITREICIRTQSLVSMLATSAAPSVSVVRQLGTLMQLRIAIVRELMLRGESLVQVTSCEVVLPSAALENPHAIAQSSSDEEQQLELSHAVVTALRLINKK